MKNSTAKKILDSAKKELQRSIEHLKAPSHPKPYYISYLIRDTESCNVWGRYGSIFASRNQHKRQCFCDIRVGSYRYDQVVKGGLKDNAEDVESFELTDLPIDAAEDGIRFSLWRLTDAKYREAVRAYHDRKSRDISFLDENKQFTSFLKAKPESSIAKIKAHKPDEERIASYIKKASLLFKPYADIKNSYVEIKQQTMTKIFVSSEGVERVFQIPSVHMTCYIWFHTKKLDQDITITFHGTSLDDLPALEEFRAIAKARIQEIYHIEQGKELTSYSGPVLLYPKPAGLLFHEVLGHRLEGNRLLSDDEGRTFKDKIGEKICHPSISIYDDPELKRFADTPLLGYYPFDDEGTAAHRADLVKNGVLKSFLSTRSPLKKKGHGSNGHARNESFERPISRMANLVVETDQGLSIEDLKAKLIEEIKQRALPYGIILVHVEGGETGTEAYNFQAFLGEITYALKIFPDGSTEPIKGVDFVGTPLSSLSQIIAVGSELEVDNGFCGAESGTIPVSTISPALLLSNLELQAKDPNKVTQYTLPLPWFETDQPTGNPLAQKPKAQSAKTQRANKSR